MLEARFATSLIGSFTQAQPIVGALISIIITSALLVLQTKQEPFLETSAAAAHWSSANRMAVVAYGCQLVVLAVGLLSILVAPLGDVIAVLLALPALAALVVPLAATIFVIVTNPEPAAVTTTTEDAESFESEVESEDPGSME